MPASISRKTPLRTCVACGAKAPQAELIRVVRFPDSSVDLDKGHKAPGRGAYVCNRNCFNKAVEKQKFQRALRTKLDKETLRELVERL